MESSLRHFKIEQFQILIEAVDSLNLPEYKGSTIRGGFGHSFKKVVCALRIKECSACMLREKCAYSYIFETPPPSDSRLMRKYPNAPHPFVLCPPLENDRIYEPGERIQFHLSLIGKAIEYLPYFIYTFEELGGMGLGKGRGKFKLVEVYAVNHDHKPSAMGVGERIYSGADKVLRNPLHPISTGERSLALSPSNALRLSFMTPVRLKFQEELVSELDFHIFFRNLLRRISLLSYFHCGQELDLDFKGLIRDASAVSISSSSLKWHDWVRYSARQETKMKMGGILGKISYSGDMSPFLPFLAIGELKSQAWVTDRTPEVIPPGIHTDMLQAYESAVRVKKMAEIIIPIHDPVIAKKTKIP